MIDDDEVRLEPAGDLWGLSNREAQQRLQRAIRAPTFRSPRSARPASGWFGMPRFRTTAGTPGAAAAGPCWARRTSRRSPSAARSACEWAEPPSSSNWRKQLSAKSFGPATAKYRELGTASNLLTFNRLNVLPTRNFQQGSFAGAAAISPEELSVVRERTRASCAACTIGCEHLYGLKNGKGAVRLEYENLFALGPLCGIDDPEVVLEACRRCDELGLDTISAGGTIAFAMECVERGYLDEPWLRFGDGAALLRALDLIVSGEGIGRLLAEGSRRMALEIGHDSIDFAPQVKGLEIPGYDPRGLQTMALGFRRRHARGRSQSLGRLRSRFLRGRRPPQRRARSGRAGDRNRRQSGADGFADPLQVPARRVQRLLCRVGRDAAAGHRLGCHGRRTSRRRRPRIVTAKKRFNILAGWTPAEDTLPDRMLRDALPEDARAQLSPERLSALVGPIIRRAAGRPEGWLPDDRVVVETLA